MATPTVHTIEGLHVSFISLVEDPANRRALLVKSAAEGEGVFERHVVIVRQDAARKIAYGLVLVPDEVDDWGDTITPEEIEKAAYNFMRSGATTQIDADHDRDAGRGFVAESWILRKGDPLFAEETEGAWAVGVKVTDEAVWKRVEKGEITGFSVMGLAHRRPLVPPDDVPGEEDVVMEKEVQGMADRFLAFIKRGLFGTNGADLSSVHDAPEVIEKGVALGNRIAARRAELEMTQQALADKMTGDAARTASTIGQIERAEIETPPPVVLRELERAPGMKSGALDAHVSTSKESGAAGKAKPTADPVGVKTDGPAPETMEKKTFKDFLEPLVERTDVAVAKQTPPTRFKDFIEPLMKDVPLPEGGLGLATATKRAPASEGDRSGGDESAALARVVTKAIKEALGPVSARLEVLEQARPGRSSVLGDDAQPVKKEKGFKGLPLRL